MAFKINRRDSKTSSVSREEKLGFHTLLGNMKTGGCPFKGTTIEQKVDFLVD